MKQSRWIWILAILHECALTAAQSAPPLCTVLSTTNNLTTYQCILCDARESALREGIVYKVNGQCSYDPLEAPVILGSSIILTDNVKVEPLDINSATPILGEIIVHGSGVTMQNLFVSETIKVVGSTVTDLTFTNLTVTESATAIDIAPNKASHDINIQGFVSNEVTSTFLSEQTDLAPIITLFHTFGATTITCSPGQTVIVQPMIPSGLFLPENCHVINFTAILDAYGNAFTFDMFGTAEPPWVGTLRSWATTLTLISLTLILITRSDKPNPAPPEPENTNVYKAPWV